jgi:hypothetical protein
VHFADGRIRPCGAAVERAVNATVSACDAWPNDKLRETLDRTDDPAQDLGPVGYRLMSGTVIHRPSATLR